MREPLIHFMLIGAVLFGIDHALVSRQDDPRTIVIDAAVDRQARETFKASRGREPDENELLALRRVWLDNEVLYREGLAMQVDKGDSAIRERVIFKALSVVDANVKLPPADDGVLRAWFERNRERYDDPARFTFDEAVLTGETSEAAVRAFAAQMNRGVAGDTNAGLRVFKGRPHANLVASYGPEFAQALETAPVGTWQALKSMDGWRAVRLDSTTPGAARPIRRVAGRRAPGLDRCGGGRAAQRGGRGADEEVHHQGRTVTPSSMRAAAVLLFFLLGFLSAGATAHELTMAEMQLRETGRGEFLWQWTAVEKRSGSAELRPVWPETCRADENMLRCGEAGLNGTLSMEGVGKGYSAVLVKVFWLDGQMRVYTLTSAHTAVRLYGSADDRRGVGEIASTYLVLGVEHILTGVDHLLFVIGLLFLVGFNRRLLWTITAVHGGPQPDAGAERARPADLATAAGRGDDRAVDHAGRRRGAAPRGHARAALAGRSSRSSSAWSTGSASPAR